LIKSKKYSDRIIDKMAVCSGRGSFIRWAGSKKKSLRLLVDKAPKKYRRYIEPFVGGGNLFFELRPKSSIICDTNDELMNMYRVLKKRPKELYENIASFPVSKEGYMSVRSEYQKNIGDELYRASRFLYLNKYCFNGVYRVNRKGMFNVPYGSKVGKFMSLEKMLEYSDALRDSEILTSDFSGIKSQLKRNDFVYLDPPYVTIKQKKFVEYGYDSFGYEDLERLFAFMRFLDKKGMCFMLSYLKCDELMANLSKEWEVSCYDVKRSVAGTSDFRVNATEMLVKNY